MFGSAKRDRLLHAQRRFDVGLLPDWYWQDERWKPAVAALSGRLGTIAVHRQPSAGSPAAGPGSPSVFAQPLESLRF